MSQEPIHDNMRQAAHAIRAAETSLRDMAAGRADPVDVVRSVSTLGHALVAILDASRDIVHELESVPQPPHSSLAPLVNTATRGIAKAGDAVVCTLAELAQTRDRSDLVIRAGRVADLLHQAGRELEAALLAIGPALDMLRRSAPDRDWRGRTW
jgi:nucleotide-binding universal stress UspA family protein